MPGLNRLWRLAEPRVLHIDDLIQPGPERLLDPVVLCLFGRIATSDAMMTVDSTILKMKFQDYDARCTETVKRRSVHNDEIRF
ncbi:hypothetical protein [Bradyrhizobium sp. SUTN9-2]|uniref:hypothetical protein n=1 Tax=Bradyrhizobium sp. SUTN9-2 TaxID=1167456 RepID=UPI0011B2474D|nr:hypothetical protein [Bradyrhizobium sp. SUTN9-2]